MYPGQRRKTHDRRPECSVMTSFSSQNLGRAMEKVSSKWHLLLIIRSRSQDLRKSNCILDFDFFNSV